MFNEAENKLADSILLYSWSYIGNYNFPFRLRTSNRTHPCGINKKGTHCE